MNESLYVVTNRFGDYDLKQFKVVNAYKTQIEAEKRAEFLQNQGRVWFDWLKCNYEKLHATPCICCETETEYIVCDRCRYIHEHDDMVAYGYTNEFTVQEVELG